MNHKFSFILLCAWIGLLHTTLIAQPADSETKEVQTPPASTQPSARTRTSANKKQSPGILGFHQGSSSVYFWLGPALAAPAGSFVAHEKVYDSTIETLIQVGNLRYLDPFGAYPVLENPGHYTSGGYFGLGLGYGISDHFELGASVATTNVFAERVPIIQDFRDGQLYAVPFSAREEMQLSASSFQFELTWHALSHSAVDPYLKLSGGPAFVSGVAHRNYYPEVNDFNEDIHNGRGLAYGGAIGVNFYLNETIVLFPEIAYMRYEFKADEFSTRSYYNTFMNIGVRIRPQLR